MKIHTRDQEDAAVEFIARWDSGGDYVCIGGEEMQVSVVPMIEAGEETEGLVFIVYGEMVPEYHAQRKVDL